MSQIPHTTDMYSLKGYYDHDKIVKHLNLKFNAHIKFSQIAIYLLGSVGR
jgi:hypothetical protein